MAAIEGADERWKDCPVRVDEPEAALNKTNKPEADSDVEEEENIHCDDGFRASEKGPQRPEPQVGGFPATKARIRFAQNALGRKEGRQYS